MAITREIVRIDIQWDNGDPVLTIIGEFKDDVEGTEASRFFPTKRSDMGAGGQTKFDSFLADVLAFADSFTGMRGITLPVFIPPPPPPPFVDPES